MNIYCVAIPIFKLSFIFYSSLIYENNNKVYETTNHNVEEYHPVFNDRVFLAVLIFEEFLKHTVDLDCF